LLKQAAAQEEDYAKYWLDRIYVTSSNQRLQNPTLAQSLLSEIYQQQRYNPIGYYLAALADYNLDNKPIAKDFLDDGIDMAKDYVWNV
jgi:hypothetical protein